MLKDLKILLGIAADDTSIDDKLNLILSAATARLTLLLGGITPPESMEHVILEAAVIRFNRIGSEGLASHTVEGESLSFAAGDFDAFAGEIQAFLNTQEDSKRGRVRFL